MSFNLREKNPLENIPKKLKKAIEPKYYTLLEERIGGAPLIDALGRDFIPVLVRWSLEAILHLCTENGVFSALEDGKTVRELLFDLGWKHAAMMEDLLDSLVDQEILRKHQREYQPLNIPERAPPESASPFSWPREWIGLRETDKQWIEHSLAYRTIFLFYEKLVSDFALESITAGVSTVTLESEAPQLCAAFDSLLRSPVYVIPRMAAVAAGVVRSNPKTILCLNCKSGWGIEEILLCKSDVDFILGIDSNSYFIEISKKNIEILREKLNFEEKTVDFRDIDDILTLTEQLDEFLGMFDMILVDQLPAWIPKEAHTTIVRKIWSLLRPNGVIALNQPLRPSLTSPWPDEWLLHTLDGFYGFPDAEFLKLFNRRPIGASTSIPTTTQTIVPILAYLIYTK